MIPVKLHTPVRHDNRAFTLIELMVAMLVALIFIGGTIMIMHSNVNAYRAQERVVDVQQEMRALMDFMVRQIRMAGSDPMRTNDMGIVEAASGKFTFTVDHNADGTIDASDRISFVLEDDTVKMMARGATELEKVMLDVQSLTFTYLDKNGEQTDAVDDIAAVTIKLAKQGRDHKGERFTRTMTATVNMRNLSL